MNLSENTRNGENNARPEGKGRVIFKQKKNPKKPQLQQFVSLEPYMNIFDVR